MSSKTTSRSGASRVAKVTFKLEPAALEITVGDEPDQLYVPGALRVLLAEAHWRCSRYDFDTRTYYFTRAQAQPLNFTPQELAKLQEAECRHGSGFLSSGRMICGRCGKDVTVNSGQD